MFERVRPAAPDEATVARIREATRARLRSASDEPWPAVRRLRGGWRRAGWRRPAIAAAVVGFATAAVAVLASGGAPSAHLETVTTSAWTVRANADGTVTLTLKDDANLPKLQQTLRADGINAVVRKIDLVWRNYLGRWMLAPVCDDEITNLAPLAVQQAVVQPLGARWVRTGDGVEINGYTTTYTIHPASMPRGSLLYISATGRTTGMIGGGPFVLSDGTLPVCVPWRIAEHQA